MDKPAAAPLKEITLIGFGEVGQAFARDLRDAGIGVKAFDIAFADPDSRQSKAALALGIAAGESHAEAVAGQDVVICAVTAGSAVQAARASMAGLKRGAFYVDVNSVSPGTKRQVWEVVKNACGRFVEASIMSTISPRGLRSPILLGGRYTAEFSAALAPLGMDLTSVGEDIGRAASIKMCRSIVIKGMEAIALEAMLTARHYGVEDVVLASLSDTIDADWPKLMRHMAGRALQHGRRRAEEMREVAKTVAEAGLTPLQSSATAQRQDWAADQGALLGPDAIRDDGLGALLDKLRAVAPSAPRAKAAE